MKTIQFCLRIYQKFREHATLQIQALKTRGMRASFTVNNDWFCCSQNNNNNNNTIPRPLWGQSTWLYALAYIPGSH